MDNIDKKYVDNLVSVIMPVYKCERYIESSVGSVLAQSYSNVEVVLVDDCSPDNSAEKIKKMAEKDERVRYFKLGKNSGAAVARNLALREAKGRYVAFLDSDDLWFPDKLDKQLKLMKEKNCFFVYGAIDIIDADGNILKVNRKIPSKINYKGLLRNTAIATSSVLLDRNVVGDFQMPLRRSGQDYATWLMLLRGNKTAYAITDTLTQYRKVEGSLSGKKTENWKKVFDIQVNCEGIRSIKAYFNAGCYMVNAVKKYFF